MKIYFVRHLKTRGNYEKRYIGRTDESLDTSILQATPIGLPKLETLYTSPMKRCLETASVLFPGVTPIIIDNLQEIDFGDFENKCYEELKENPDYIKFIDSNGTGEIPHGENTADFKRRCCKAFLEITERMIENKETSSMIVCHGGTIMSILERFDENPKSFYDYQVKNGSGYETEYDPETRKLKIIKELI